MSDDGFLGESDLMRQAELRLVLEKTVEELFQIGNRLEQKMGDAPDDEPPCVMKEYMTIVGYEYVSREGRRGGDVVVLVKDGAMPTYLARGLISSASEYVEHEAWNYAEDSEGD